MTALLTALAAALLLAGGMSLGVWLGRRRPSSTGDGPLLPPMLTRGLVEQWGREPAQEGRQRALEAAWLRLDKQHRSDVAVLNAEIDHLSARVPLDGPQLSGWQHGEG